MTYLHIGAKPVSLPKQQPTNGQVFKWSKLWGCLFLTTTEIILVYSSKLRSIVQENKSKNEMQDPGDRNWSRNHLGILFIALISMTCSDCFLTALRITFLVMAPHTVSWFFPHYHSLSKCPHRRAYRPVLWRKFSQLKIPSSRLTVACVRLIEKVAFIIHVPVYRSFSAVQTVGNLWEHIITLENQLNHIAL